MRAPLTVLLLLALSVPGWGQAADSLSRADSLKGGVPDIVPEAFRTDPAQFKEGKGVAVDTLDIADGNLLLVLKDDHTWYYIKNIHKLQEEDVFKDHWLVNTTDAYRLPLDSLPLHNTILLVDSTSRFVCPNRTKVYSKFGYRHGRRHQGVDLPLKTGTPVVAAFDGRVRMSEYHSGYGNLIIIRHENGLETYYGHLSKREVEVGDWVSAGQEIGKGGSTGRATGPHLHFETRYQGYAFDPEWLIDFETGTLRSGVFTLKKKYLSELSNYVPESEDEEEEILLAEAEDREAEAKKAAEEAAKQYHTIKSGDTLGALAVRYHTTVSKLCSMNGIKSTTTLRIGQRLRVK